MKVWKKLIIFVSIALCIQLTVLVYINNYMLDSFSAFSAEDVKPEEEIEEVPKILMPEAITEMQASFDGRYCSYYKDNTLFVIDTQNGMRKKIQFIEGQTLNLFKWHDSKNKIILAEQTTINGAGRLKLTTYDAQLGHKEDLRDLSWLGNNIKIEELDFAGENDLVVKVTGTKGKSDLYYIGSEVTKLTVATNNIGLMEYAGKENKVLYQDKTTKKYYITGDKKAVDIKGDASKVIKLDSTGNIFVSDKSSGAVSSIFYKDLNNVNDTWHSIYFQQPIELSNIYIDTKDSIYIDNSFEGKFTKINQSTDTTYEGKLMSFFKGGIFTLKENMLQKQEFKSETIN